MEVLKRYFPFSFKEKSDLRGLLINVLLYLAAAAIIGVFIGIFSGVPVINWIFGIIGALVEIYVVLGILLSVLDYAKK